jgi:hypothetical protein
VLDGEIEWRFWSALDRFGFWSIVFCLLFLLLFLLYVVSPE